MIGYLNGRILEHTEGRMLVGVGDPAQGTVGYSVSVPQNGAYLGLLPGARIELFVYSHVREDAFDLYGFMSAVEKDLYLTLLSVNGIGPKGALGILSGAEPAQLIQAILENNKKFLTDLPGVGKKTVERLVLELADPVRKKVEAGIYAAPSRAARASASAGASARDQGADTPAVRDAKAALIGLGYKELDVAQLLSRVMADAENPPTRAEDLIRSALRQLSG